MIRFIETYCVFSNGRWTGKPFKLRRWQKERILEIFEINPETGFRKYRRVVLGVPRKNGKTELAAALALYFTIADQEPSAEVYCAAASEDQADRVFEAARRMCEVDGAPLAKWVRIPTGKSGNRIVSKLDPYSYLRRLASVGSTQHGLNAHAVILDEYHAWKKGEQEELNAALTTSMAAREQPMQIIITTAGADKAESRCGELYDRGRAIESGRIQDDSFYFRWWEAPPEYDYKDPEGWKIANPNWGVTISESFLQAELAGLTGEVGRGALTRADFERLYLNRWVSYDKTPFVTREQLETCRVAEFELKDRVPTVVGVDLSETRDSTAVVIGQFRSDKERPCEHEDGNPCLFIRCFTWERPLGAMDRPQEDWRVPQNEIKERIRQVNKTCTVAANIFDPWHSRLMREDLAGEGLPVEEIWQTGARRSGASAELYDLIVQGRIHWCDQVFRDHCLNATTRIAGKDGGFYLAKVKAGKAMDCAMATVNVVYGFRFGKKNEVGGILFWLPEPEKKEEATA